MPDQAVVTWFTGPASSLPTLARSWDALNERSGGLPFLETTFLLPLLEQMGGEGLQLAWAESSGQWVAAALLSPAGFGRLETWQPSQLPLGAWLMAAGQDMPSLTMQLMAHLGLGTAALALTQIDPLFCARPAEQPQLHTLDYVKTAWVDVQGTFSTYWDARGKNLRTNMRKQRSKLQADGIALSFDVLTDPADVATAIAEYGRLETAGWKADTGTAVHPDNAQGRFYTQMMQRFCALGRGCIWRLKFGDAVVAMDLCILGGSTLVVLKTSYDPEYRTVSPAFLLKQEAFGRVFDEARVQRIEFYGKLMEWHMRWTDNARLLYHGNVYRWSWVPRARSLLRRFTAKPTQATADLTSI